MCGSEDVTQYNYVMHFAIYVLQLTCSLLSDVLYGRLPKTYINTKTYRTCFSGHYNSYDENASANHLFFCSFSWNAFNSCYFFDEGGNFLLSGILLKYSRLDISFVHLSNNAVQRSKFSYCFESGEDLSDWLQKRFTLRGGVWKSEFHDGRQTSTYSLQSVGCKW